MLIDEAQDLKATALEELRLLTNLTADRRPLLQIFLVGQEELRQTVLSPALKQLHQRIVAACHLEPIDRDLTEDYVKHRLTQVGWQDDPHFSDEIFPFIHKFSGGVPRLINMICGRLLLHGMVEELHELGIKEIQSTVEDLIEEQLLPVNRKLQQNPAMFWK